MDWELDARRIVCFQIVIGVWMALSYPAVYAQSRCREQKWAVVRRADFAQCSLWSGIGVMVVRVRGNTMRSESVSRWYLLLQLSNPRHNTSIA